MVFAFALPLSATASDAKTPKARAICFVMRGPSGEGAYPRSGFPEKPPCTASELFPRSLPAPERLQVRRQRRPQVHRLAGGRVREADPLGVERVARQPQAA